MLKSADLARTVVSLLPNVLRRSTPHRTLVAFTTGTVLEYITRAKALDEGALAMLVSALVAPLERDVLRRAEEDAKLGMAIKEAVVSSLAFVACSRSRCIY
jgi:U3 small nucleolar RNA-associated protein 10